MQMQIIHLPNPQNRFPGKARGDPIHQTPADAPEMVSHRATAHDCLAHCELSEFVLPVDVR